MSTRRRAKNHQYPKKEKAAPSGTALSDLHHRSEVDLRYAVAPQVCSEPGTVFTEFCALPAGVQVWTARVRLYAVGTCIRC
ncbi:hypothetical protein BG55_03765 [Erwinia mallotivora]|uniref:Uncharacterized protein n=1 Tax=Erwinia mallotivora TaxID=69222 RepID=A0A014Q0U3_9GAMM|nr:hypothetical protein BG55_03765 [Erwinia mallotivora]